MKHGRGQNISQIIVDEFYSNINICFLEDGGGSVPRSTSDVTAAIHSDCNRERMQGDQPQQPNRRMSHQERLKHPPPLSPRTGRHPNMPVCITCYICTINRSYICYWSKLLLVMIMPITIMACHVNLHCIKILIRKFRSNSKPRHMM